MHVPFNDLKIQYEALRGDIRPALDRVLESQQYILGPEVEAFERAFAKYCGAKYAVGVNSGTMALQLALLALGAGAGDEVITVAQTFIATAEAISWTGATPVFLDVEEETYTLDVSRLEAAITPRTKGILPVHLYGHPARMDEILRIAAKHKLFVLEDAAQAHGATWQSKRVGGFGQTACFSFYPGKNLGAFGEGGAVVTNDAKIAEEIKKLRNHGGVVRYTHERLGFNGRMEAIQGAVLGVKLPHLDDWNARRRVHAKRYHERLRELDSRQKNAGMTCGQRPHVHERPSLRAGAGMTCGQQPHVHERPSLRAGAGMTSGLVLPREAAGAQSVYNSYVIRTEKRDALQKHLTASGIQTQIYYPVNIHLLDFYKQLGYKKGDLPVTEALVRTGLALPIFPDLTEAQVDYVAQKMREFF